jgi:hypothetical protein
LHLHTLSRILRLALLVLVVSPLLHFCVFLRSLFTTTFLWVGGEWPMVGKLKIERANSNLVWDQMPTHFRSLWCWQRLEFFREPFWIGFL